MAAVLIKKYGNRRLYDTGDSRYVTLDELSAKIRGGADLRIVDAQTGEDLTQATLTQLVLETGNAAKFLPVQLLTQMIRLSDDSLAEFFSRYVTGALDMYLQARRGVQAISTYNPLAQIPVAASDALARMWMASPFGSPYAQPGYAPGYPHAPPPGYGAPSNGFPAPPPPAPSAHASSEAPDDRDPEGPVTTPHTSGGSGEVAAMRRELDELKSLMRESIAASHAPAPHAPAPRKKRKP